MAKKIEAFYEALGTNIQGARDRLKMTQAQLGLTLVPPSTRASIANIENGKQRVLVHTLVQLARALETKVEKLIPSEAPPGQANLSDVENELKRKLNLAAPQLRKLTIAANPAAPKKRKQS
jgi:transcriptional regulator with XRE-family HTH domain